MLEFETVVEIVMDGVWLLIMVQTRIDLKVATHILHSRFKCPIVQPGAGLTELSISSDLLILPQRCH